MDEFFEISEELEFSLNFNDMKVKLKVELKKIKSMNIDSSELNEIVKKMEDILN